MDDFQKAGRIAAEALQYGKKLVRVDASLLEAAEKIEEKIRELGGKPGFPVNISMNHIAAHYTPFPNDETRFKKGDLVKLDVGVHVNGKIGDTALTVDLGNNKELVEASENALRAALKIIRPGAKLREIGKVIQEEIQAKGFNPIINLSGHEVGEYKIHAGITIPNYDNGNETELEEGQTIAIEPFATTGEGKVMEGKPSGIYRVEKIKPTRNPTARKIIEHVAEEYKTMPFAKRWILKKFPNGTLPLVLLEREGIIHQYPQLVESAKGLVSQAEHTVVVKEKPEITTKISQDNQ